MTASDTMRGRFVTLEGIEGVGKSTNVEFVRDQIEAAGHRVIVTREPGGTALAERIRHVVLTATGETVPPVCELLLMFAARSAHVNNRIRPALEDGVWVVCDRFTDATVAYQGFGRRADLDKIGALADWVHGDIWPDLTLLLDAPVEIGLSRVQKRGKPDRIESERAAFFNRVREGYLSLADRHPERIVKVDASESLGLVRPQRQDAQRPRVG
ncbi:MAG: dTMP kinase [Pseudomonadota bacterium]